MIHFLRNEYEQLRLLAAVQNKNKALLVLREKLGAASVFAEETLPPGVVCLNSRVRIEDMDSGERNEYTISLPQHADAEYGRLSVLSPLGVALVGHREGDTIECATPGGSRRIRIEEVHSGEAPSRESDALPYGHQFLQRITEPAGVRW